MKPQISLAKRCKEKMVPGKSCFLQQEMTGAGQAHVVNLTVLQPGKVSCDFNSVISAPCVLCHAGNGRNLEGTLWISSAPRELLGAVCSRLRLCQGTGCCFSAGFTGNLEVPKLRETFGSEFLCRGKQGTAHLQQGVLSLITAGLEKGMGGNPV